MTKEESKETQTFRFDQGRRFHNNSEVSYVLPNDYDELDRLSQQHVMFRFIFQSNFHAPIEEQLRKGIDVLDSGCGPGSWTLDMAQTFPNSRFYGVDVSDVFYSTTLSNVQFKVNNIAKEITFPDQSFDYTYQRLLFLGLTDTDWDNSLLELYRVLKPGGYAEFLETDTDKVVNSGPLFEKLLAALAGFVKLRGLSITMGGQLEEKTKKAGFVNQTKKLYEFNMNHTDKAGEMFWDDFKAGHFGLRPALSHVYPEWSDPEVFEDFLNQVGLETKQNKTCAVFCVHIVQKPF